MIHKPKCENNVVTTIRTSPESHLLWKNHFHRNPLSFRIYADFETDNEIDIFSIGNKKTNIYPVLDGYLIESELEDVLKSGYYKSPLGYNDVDWCVVDVIKLENKMNFYFRNTKKDMIITQDKGEDFRNNNIC